MADFKTSVSKNAIIKSPKASVFGNIPKATHAKRNVIHHPFYRNFRESLNPQKYISEIYASFFP